MAVLFNRNTKTIKEVYDDFNNERLIIDMSYQRRKVWMPQDKVRLIETILLDYVIPEIFFWPANIDADTGNMITHIVDGQQRVNAIVEFISGEFELLTKYLLDEKIKDACGNKKFSLLPEEYRKKIWVYKLSIVDMDQSFTKSAIKQMFYRLNLTDYSLNHQEKRNSKESYFGDLAEALSKLDFWKTCKVFSSADARRMKDVEYCCSIYILAREGIVDQTNDKKINDYYDDYSESFEEGEILTTKIEAAMSIIKSLSDKSTISFISKKAQMYTMFSMAFRLLDGNIECSQEIFERFKLFVAAYNLFRNEFEINFQDTPKLREINESVKKYKLASSEGINKINNRMIRYQTLTNICLADSDEIKEDLRKLAKIYEQQRVSDVAYETFDNEDIIDTNDSAQE